MNNPLVSIIIPTYARPTNLIRAIESVLTQTYTPIEIIVVDDNGVNTPFQKETEQLLAPYLSDGKLTYLKHDVNKNGSAARNTGSRASHGELIGYLDDDDTFMPTKIEEQVRRLQEAHTVNSKVMGIYCNIEMIGYKMKFEPTDTVKEGNLSEPIMAGEINLNSSTLLMYRSAYDDINGWDERFPHHQDWEFCLRFFRKYEMALARPDICLVRKFRTPNLNFLNPKRKACNMDFFLTEMLPDFMNMPNGCAVLSKRYLEATKYAFENRQYRFGLAMLKNANSFKNIGVTGYYQLLKGLIKGIIV